MKRPLAGLIGMVLALWASPVPAQDNGRPAAPGPHGAEQGAYRQQLWLVPSQDNMVLMRTTVFRPKGAGPFPLVVINHGSLQNAQERKRFAQPLYAAAAEFFVQRGYAVAVPQRPGHGETGGPYLESQSAKGEVCEDVDFARAGFAVADSTQAAIRYLTQQPFIQRAGVIVVGFSAGGWGALALASRNPREVAAIISFAGGRGGRVHNRPNNNCEPEKLIETAALFGSTARVPVLSIHARNDTFFPADLSGRIADAYRSRGGRMDYRLLPAFGDDGHRLFGAPGGIAVWGPIVDELLTGLRRPS